MNNAPVQQVMPGLVPFRSKTGQLIEDSANNRIIALETPYRTDQIKSMLTAVDRAQETRAFEVRDGSVEPLAQRLKSYLPAGTKIEADAAGRRILVTGGRSVLDQAERTIRLLDRMEDQQTRAFTIEYASPDPVKRAIQPLLTPGVGAAWIDDRTRQLFVTDFADGTEAVAGRIAQLDIPRRQVLIEARIIQVTMDDEIKTGIDWEILESQSTTE